MYHWRFFTTFVINKSTRWTLNQAINNEIEPWSYCFRQPNILFWAISEKVNKMPKLIWWTRKESIFSQRSKWFNIKNCIWFIEWLGLGVLEVVPKCLRRFTLYMHNELLFLSWTYRTFGDARETLYLCGSHFSDVMIAYMIILQQLYRQTTEKPKQNSQKLKCIKLL